MNSGVDGKVRPGHAAPPGLTDGDEQKEIPLKKPTKVSVYSDYPRNAAIR
jgi:hypothetical protein